MRKIFISQPMKNKTKEEIMKEREAIIENLKKYFALRIDSEFEVIDSVLTISEEESAKHTNPSVWYLGKSIKLLADADYIYSAKGWQDANGCRIEREVAVTYNIPIIPTLIEEEE